MKVPHFFVRIFSSMHIFICNAFRIVIFPLRVFRPRIVSSSLFTLPFTWLRLRGLPFTPNLGVTAA